MKELEPHPQADILIAIAQGKTIEGRLPSTPWEVQEFPCLVIGKPGWELRIKPETININGREVPCPVQEPLKEGTEYWRVALESPGLCAMKIWEEDQYDARYLERRIAHMHVSDCEKHAEALLSFTRSDK